MTSEPDQHEVARRRIRALPLGLLTVWFGQLVSSAGSAITAFVLGVWVFEQTGSTTQFAMLMLSAVVPGILISPFAGIWADRYNRRVLMVVADLTGGVGTASLLTLVLTDHLATWQIYPLTMLTAAAAAVHGIAFSSTLPALVAAANLSKANGLTQTTQAVQIAAPVLAAAMLAAFGLRGVLILDLATMFFGVFMLVSARLPPGSTSPANNGTKITVRSDLTHGWAYLRADRPLRDLVLVFTAFNAVFAVAGVLVQPLILSFTGTETLGVLMLLGGAGIFVGGLVMATWGGPVPRIPGMAKFLVLGGLALAAHALAPSALLIGIVAPLFLCVIPILGGSAMTLIQQRTKPESMGRVIATVRILAQAAMPVGYLIAGPVADRIFEPAMQPGHWLGDTLGKVIGTGEGRGIAAIYLVLGLLTLLLAARVATWRNLRLLEAEVDARLAQAAGPAAAGETAAPEVAATLDPDAPAASDAALDVETRGA